MEYSSCSFTGHRVIEPRHVDEIIALLDRAVAYAYSVGVRTFYSGGAIGFDTMAARAVVKFRLMHPDVSLVMLLPCADQDSRWSASQQGGYQYLLSVANEVVYLSDGYYDLTEHTYKTYEDESELPKYRMDKQEADRNIRDILREDATLAEYLEGEVYYADTSYRLNDRIYASLVIGENVHDAPIEEYEGSTLLLVMLDADTYEVLYAEAYHSTNYYLGAMSERIAMYRQGADGFLYDPYILE